MVAVQVNSDEQRPFYLQSVLDAVSSDYGVTLFNLASRRRSKILNEARSVLAFMVHHQRNVSLGELGRTLNRYYPTISVTASRAAQRARRDSKFSRRLSALGRKVTKELKS
jgi:chromosomal replication initiation ATPase DnaA